MTGVPGRSVRAAAAVLCCGALLLPAAPAWAAPTPGTATPTPGGADPAALPVIGQNRGAGRPDGCLKPSDKGTDRTPWAQTYLRPEAAWQLSRGAGVTVAVVGSGVDPASGVLDGRLTPGPREFGTGDSTRDCVGHGTFLAGLIAARRQDGVGFAGIAPEARILAVAVTDDAGITTPALLAKGVRDAADGGARVIAVGLALPTGEAELGDAVRYATGKGALVIAPAAPDQGGTSPSAPSAPPAAAYPAALPDVLAVSDLAPNGAPPSGAADAVRVDLAAPGDAVLSVGPGGKGYFTGAGPSFATALVAGTAALALAYRPDLTPARLADRLRATAYHPGTALPDPHLGYGTVDPLAALSTPLPGDATATPRPALTVSLVQAPPPDPAPHQAALIAGGTVAGVTLIVGAALMCTAGRRRAWRPGRWSA
ncbi:membrane-anchored mycosin MYCP [Kitasatospora sp. MAA19]|uniref:S8 family serine peptidase n=1 Tax=Kitasatospora sp. MAA19 TaxID=3035090 RepID=UPI002476ADD5|nr:S8 family serine peptidase [Kitasatospora sp. MAA19]MDH6707594.1 membrane-anchored mycosin MYCP [Kitasatospora sp. MAA19]